MAEPIECRLGCGPGWKEPCVTWGAHWRHLANTIERSMFGGPAKRLNRARCVWGVGPRSLQGKGEFSGKDMPGHARLYSACAVQKWLNRSTCRLSCGFGMGEKMFGGPAKTAEAMEMPFGLWTDLGGPRNHFDVGYYTLPPRGEYH